VIVSTHNTQAKHTLAVDDALHDDAAVGARVLCDELQRVRQRLLHDLGTNLVVG
jgi:hypothetical protein